MRGTTPPPTPTILLCLVSLESMTKQFSVINFFHVLCIVRIRYLVFQPIQGQNTQSPKQESWHVQRMFYRKLGKKEVCFIYSVLCTYHSLFKGLTIGEVAHDIQQQVAKHVRNEGLVNSYDTWHGMT